MKSDSHSIIRNALRSLSGLLHSTLSGLDYASAGHTGFEPTVTKGNLTSGAGITIGGTGTGAVIGAGASVTNSDTGSGAVATHNSAYTHSDIALNTTARHTRSHAIGSTSDHTSTTTPDLMLKADASGLPVGAHNTDTEVIAAVNATHGRQHSITNTSDHTSSATSGKMLKADTNGLPADATNTDAQVSATVTASHARQHALDSTADHSVGSLVGALPVFTDATPTKLITKSIADAYAAIVTATTRFNVITKTHDASVAGDEAYTGMGFAPKAVIIWVACSAVVGLIGFGAFCAGGQGGILSYGILTPNLWDVTNTPTYISQFFHNSAGTIYTMAVGKSLDADGITKTWSEGLLPTRTYKLMFFEMR